VELILYGGYRMSEARIISMTDDFTDFSTNAQKHRHGRLTMPLWLCRYYRRKSGDAIRLDIRKGNQLFRGILNLTSGTEIVAREESALYRILTPGARIRVRLYRPL